MREGETGG